MLTPTQVQAITDSVGQSIFDFNSVMNGLTTSTPSINTIITGVSGTTTSNTVGRILNLNDLIPELNLLNAVNTAASNVSAYLNGLSTKNSFYAQFFPFFDKLDQTVLYNGASGLNNFLTGNALQVNAYFANAFNYWCANAVAVTPGRTFANAPVPLSARNFFPSVDIDNMWTFSTSTGTTMSTSAVGTNASTAVAGGGTGQFYLYKSNAGATAGGATFTISYINGSGSIATATYTTASNIPAPSGSLATGYAITGAIGSSITGVTGAGMTAGESYTIGMKLVRALAGY